MRGTWLFGFLDVEFKGFCPQLHLLAVLCLELFSFLVRVHMAQLLTILVTLLRGHKLAAIDHPLPWRYEIFALQLRTFLHP